MAATTATATPEATNDKKLTVTWVKSAIGYNVRQKRTLKALGFSKLGQTVQHVDNPALRGMLNAVRHLVEVTEK
jgi:large subunit ribosomal protein L30